MIQGVYKRTQNQRAKRRETRKKTHKDPTAAENPKHPNKNQKPSITLHLRTLLLLPRV
jgi:hypothetical protein